LFSGVEAAIRGASTPVEELRAAELESYPGTGEAHDRLVIETVGDIALAQQRAYKSFDSIRPVGGEDARSLREPLQGMLE
jgi:hypothetical protein